MASLQNSSFENQIPDEFLLARIMQIHVSISKLGSLKPSKQVNSLFSQLVKLCTHPSSPDITNLSQEVQEIRESLINLCGRAEGLLELDFATFLIKFPQPLNNLNLFPYYKNYVELTNLEYSIPKENGVMQPRKVAFVGSCPMPLTSMLMATHHMKFTHFDNFDIDETANDVARCVIASDVELRKRMKLVEYDCIFLAALVGMSKEEKVKILEHIRKYMKEVSVFLVRSAKGARAFLYPIVEEHDLVGFEVLSIFHPTNDVINSVLIRKPNLQNM